MRIERFNSEASAVTGTSPTPAQIAEHAGVSVEAVIEAREAYQALRADSLDQPQHAGDDDGRGLLVDTLGGHDPDLDSAFERMVLDSLIETLEDRERTIVQLYYREELTQAEIGRRLGYSQMHISRLLRQATARLVQGAAQEPVLDAHAVA